MYINDLTLATQFSLFADDTKLYKNLENIVT